MLFLKSYYFDEKLSPQIFGIKDIKSNYHHFFVGYYDIDPISKDGYNILCHRVSGKFKNEITPKVGHIGLMNINNGLFKILTKTNALNWQLASRAQWLDESKIIFNDVEKGYQISCKFDVVKKKILKKYKRSFWAISPNKKIGASLNFSRINKKRPGYGYRGKSIDGDFEFFSLFDLDTGEDIYKINIFEIIKKINFSPSGNDPYLNHVCWAPCSTKLLTIFHFAEDDKTPRKVYPIIFDIKKKNWYCIDKNSMFSHHVWLNKDNLLAYRREDNQNAFCIWSKNSKWEIVNKSMPKNDGHPSFIKKSKKIVLDSYPNTFGIMNIYKTIKRI